MPRDYNINPIEVEFTVKMFYYEPINKLDEKLKQMCDSNTSSIIEGIFYELQIVDNCGMGEFTAKVVVGVNSIC